MKFFPSEMLASRLLPFDTLQMERRLARIRKSLVRLLQETLFADGAAVHTTDVVCGGSRQLSRDPMRAFLPCQQPAPYNLYDKEITNEARGGLPSH